MCNEDGVWLSMFGSSYVLQLIFFDQWMKTGMNKLEWNFKYSSHGNFFSFNTYFFSSKGIKFGNYFFLKIKNVFVFPQLWLSFLKIYILWTERISLFELSWNVTVWMTTIFIMLYDFFIWVHHVFHSSYSLDYLVSLPLQYRTATVIFSKLWICKERLNPSRTFFFFFLWRN